MSEVEQSERSGALESVRRQIERYGFTAEELYPPASDEDGRSSLLVKVLSYLGGMFVFAGIAIFIALQWDAMASAARVIVTLGSGVVCFVLSLLAAADDRYRGAAIPLMLIAAVLEPTGIMVALYEFGSGGDEQVAALLTAGAMGAQFLLTYTRYKLTTVLLVATFFASAAWGLALDLADFDFSLIALSSGLGWLLLGLHFNRGAHDAITPPLFLLGCWGALYGLFDMVEDSVLELGFLAAACALTYLGVWARSRALNFGSTIAILAYTAYFTGEHFADSVGWPIALIVIGLLMIGISALALRIDRKYLRAAG
jgi:hypothetical protein